MPIRAYPTGLFEKPTIDDKSQNKTSSIFYASNDAHSKIINCLIFDKTIFNHHVSL